MNTNADYIHELMQRLKDADGRQGAIQLLADAADAHPADARPLLLLAAEFAENRDMDRAEAAYAAALQRAPDFWIARFQLGLLQFTSARPAVARVTWAPLDSLEEQHPLRLFKRAFEQLAEDDFEGARDLLHEGIAANSANPPLNRDMERLLERIARQEQGNPAEHDAPQGMTDAHFLVSAYKSLH
jgi:tetratricopeptide (TPR) repeat protein